jgi:uncharacterized protein (DUF488 family)
LLEYATEAPTAIMCAEALWWQCHRRLLADYLTALGHEVLHIQSPTKAEAHRLVDPARVVGGRLSYQADPEQLALL